MANDPFDFSDVFAEIENKVADVMQSSEAEQKLKETMSRFAMSDVYGQYFPTMYSRQYRLSTPGNYTVSASADSITVENVNISDEIFNVIEGGSGYRWKGSQIYKMEPFPRPYTQHAIDSFVDDWLMPEIERQISSK